MPNADLGLTLHCPKCHRILAYISSTGTAPHDLTRVYECPEHGRWVMTPDRDFHPQPPAVH